VIRRNLGSGKLTALLLAAVFAVGIAATGCGSSSGDSGSGGEPTKKLQTLVWDKPQEVFGLDPATTSISSSWQINDLTYETLVTIDGKKIVPALATAWTNPNPTTYVFDLRPGVKFSNGRAMTADDVVGSLNRLIDPETASYWAPELGEVKSITAPDPEHVELKLAKPQTPLLAALAGIAAAILPMEELEDGSFDPNKEMLGTGPYEVVSHRQNRDWQFTANPHYWRKGEPKIENLTVNIVTEEAAAIADLRTGAAQIATFESSSAPQLVAGVPNVKTTIQPSTDYWVMDLNAKSSLFTDPRLREAVALALDRDQIAEVGLDNLGEPSPPSAPGLEGSCETAGLPTYETDIEKAKQLVEEAGATGETVEIIASPVTADIPRIGQVVQQQLAETGLDVKILPLGEAEWTNRVYAGKAEFDADISFFAGYADPGMVLAWWNADFAVFNKAWLKPDPELTALITKQLQTPNGPERTEVLRQTCERAAAGANMIPLVTKPGIVAYREDLLIASFAPIEGYDMPLRRIATFGP
jgi:peptide/nickel transport system substrate-binding protein